MVKIIMFAKVALIGPLVMIVLVLDYALNWLVMCSHLGVYKQHSHLIFPM